MGTCATGLEICDLDGTWSQECSKRPQERDSCIVDNDDSCNGIPNEDCECFSGEERPCSEGGYSGPCADGVQVCDEFGAWSSCSIEPAAEDTCEPGNNEDCQGEENDGCLCIEGVTTRACGACGTQICTDGKNDRYGECIEGDCESQDICGDGIITGDEECDEGSRNTERSTICTPECRRPICGDGYESSAEGCDDGNLDSGDGCSATCVDEQCFEIQDVFGAPLTCSGSSRFCIGLGASDWTIGRAACETCEGVPCTRYTYDCAQDVVGYYNREDPNTLDGYRLFVYEAGECSFSGEPAEPVSFGTILVIASMGPLYSTGTFSTIVE